LLRARAHGAGAAAGQDACAEAEEKQRDAPYDSAAQTRPQTVGGSASGFKSSSRPAVPAAAASDSGGGGGRSVALVLAVTSALAIFGAVGGRLSVAGGARAAVLA